MTFIVDSVLRCVKRKSASSELDLYDRDQTLKRLHYYCGFGMPHNNVSVTLIASGRRLSGNRKLYINDQRSHFAADLIEAMHVTNPPTPLAAKERSSNRVLPRRTLEPAEHHHFGPCADEVDIVRA